jgi:hypothetical protein
MFPSGLKRTWRGLLVFAAIVLGLSCGGYKSPSPLANNSGLHSRAFVSNPVFPSALGGGSPAVQIVDAEKDLLSLATIQLSTLSGSVSSAGMMSLSPSHDRTLLLSPSDSKIAVIDNVKESMQGVITLPGPSESVFVSSDNTTGFAAVPTASVVGQAPGAVVEFNTSTGSITATILIPGAHYLVASPSGNQVLVLSDNQNAVTLLTPSLLVPGAHTTTAPCSTTQVPVCSLSLTFDHPVGAVFDSSGSTAYVLNCGPECGGSSAGVFVVNMAAISSANALTGTISLPAATTALLQGTTLYVAGTPSGSGGTLAVLNLASAVSAVNCGSQPGANCQIFSVTNGFHNRIAMGANGQLFVGAHGCANCLAILDTVHSKVIVPSASGDVTGIAPIPNRNVVYVCQGGALLVYDTTTDQLENIPNVGQPNIIGQAVDVKTIDF